jgi:mannosyltransferase
LLGVAFGAVAVSIVVRFMGPRALWLDEALTVNIARLPIPRLFDALRHDGSPPAYYIALHYWMGLFGTGTWTVRALAGTFSVLTLPASWRLGRAVGGRRVAIALLVLTACNPFALRYGTENRMYSLVMLLVTLLALALVRALQRPTVLRLVVLGLLCGLLLLTHYWALYLIAGLGTCLVVGSLWGPLRANARLATAAVASGCLLFLPWLPSFVFQAQHTGTPWAASPSPMAIIDVLGEFAGYEQHTGIPVFVLFWASFVILAAAVILPAIPLTRRVAGFLGWKRPVPGARLAGPTAGVFLATLAFAMLGGVVANAAFAWRYASVVMPFVVLLVALGLVAAGSTRLGRIVTAAALAALGVLGVMAGTQEVLAPRTQAAAVAAQIAADARPGDVVAYCPDQLGPAVSRLLPDRLLTQVTFPRFDDPERINWVDYARVNEAANPGVFARQVLNLAGPHQVWLVWAPGYRTLGRDCQEIRDALELARTAHVLAVRSSPGKYYEPANLIRFAPD